MAQRSRGSSLQVLVVVVAAAVVAVAARASADGAGDDAAQAALTEMARIKGGPATLGSPEAPRDGESPPHKVKLPTFWLDKTTVTNAAFREFVRATKYKTEAEKLFGWSFVFHAFVDEEVKAGINETVKGAEFWLPVPHAYWRMPFGRGSSIKGRMDYPVVQVSQNDAKAFCEWAGKRLPTEDEWEFAARGGLVNKEYPWGKKLEPKRMNLWQGKFPDENTKEDGYHGAAPANAYRPQTGAGVYNLLGNVWEWTDSSFTDPQPQGMPPGAPPPEDKVVLRGGSYIDSVDGSTNHRVRVTTRMGNTKDSASDNIGFRCASSVDPKKIATKGKGKARGAAAKKTRSPSDL